MPQPCRGLGLPQPRGFVALRAVSTPSLPLPFSEAGKSQMGAEVLLPPCLLRRSTKHPLPN